MSRKRVKRRRPNDEPSEPAPGPAAEEPAIGRAIRIAGFVALAGGVAGALLDPGAIAGAVAASIALIGTLTAVFAGLYRDRALRRAHLARPRSPIIFPLGTLLVLAGAAALLYPCFVTRDALREIAEAYTYGPLVAVAFLFSGVALLIDGVDRAAPSEPEFAVPDPPTLTEKLLFFNPLQIFLIPVALVAPRFWPRVPILWYLYESWLELDRETQAARTAEAASVEGQPARGYRWAPLAVFTTGAVFLSLMEYFGHAPTLRDLIAHFAPLGPADLVAEDSSIWVLMRDSPFSRLIEFAWWSGWRVLGFFLLPALVVRVILRERVLDHGLQTRGFLGHAWIYVGFFVYVLVAVVVVSYDEHFSTYYPFYKSASRSWYDFWTWELLYAAQFFSLEFFFRGFWLKAAKPSMGSHAIYAMVVPYCMIHFGKPFLETLAAVLAGVVLGTLALRTRSIWAGFLIHVSVAISMDIAALLQTTGLPDQWWPSV